MVGGIRLAVVAGFVIAAAGVGYGLIGTAEADGARKSSAILWAVSGACSAALVQGAAFRALAMRHGRSQVAFLGGILATFLLRVVVAALLAATVLVIARREALPFLVGFGAQYVVLEVLIDVGFVKASGAAGATGATRTRE